MSQKSRERRERQRGKMREGTAKPSFPQMLCDVAANHLALTDRDLVIQAQSIYELVDNIFSKRPMYDQRRYWNIYRSNRYSDDYGVRVDEELEETIADWCDSESLYWRDVIHGLKLPLGRERVFVEFHVTDESDVLYDCRIGVLLTANSYQYTDTLSAKTFILAKKGSNFALKEDRDYEWTMPITDDEIDGEYFYLSKMEDSLLDIFDYRKLVPLMALTYLNMDDPTFEPIDWRPSGLLLPDSRSERAKMTTSLRFEILERDGFQCRSCGRNPREHQIKLHVDHIIPIARGGETEPYNLHTLCEDCNLGKRDKRVEQMETW